MYPAKYRQLTDLFPIDKPSISVEKLRVTVPSYSSEESIAMVWDITGIPHKNEYRSDVCLRHKYLGKRTIGSSGNYQIFWESVSRFSRGTVLNTLNQSVINILRGKKDATTCICV